MTRQTDIMHQPTDNPDTAATTRTPSDSHETRIVTALAEARKARHHRDCRCRTFQHRWCNAADALWSNACDRELGQWAAEHNRSNQQ